MQKGLTLIFLCSMAISQVSAQDKQSISDALKEQQKSTQELKEEIQKKREAADPFSDKAALVIWDNIEAVLEAKSQCFKKGEDIDMHLCIHESIKKLAEAGNFAAQDSVAKTYLEEPQVNLAMALSWFKKALENPNTPREYKEYILEDAQKIEEALKKGDLSNNEEKPLSEGLKEDMAYIATEHQHIQNEIKKAQTTQDKETLAMLSELEEVFHSQKPCFELKEEFDIQVCMLRQIKTLADKGNFFAQHQLGNIYENSIQNKAMAIKWYNTAIRNPKTPKSYIPQIQSDLNRVKSKTATS